jgi:hypothetical protein
MSCTAARTASCFRLRAGSACAGSSAQPGQRARSAGSAAPSGTAIHQGAEATCASSRPSCAGNGRNTNLRQFRQNDQDRHLMMTELMLDIRKYPQCLCWLPADNVIPCVVTSMLPFGKTQKRKIALQRRSVTRSKLNSRPCRVAKLPTLPPRSATSTPEPAAKSP